MTTISAIPKDLNIHAIEHNGLIWLNIEKPTRAETNFLRENFPFHPLDLEDCLSKIQLPKLDEYPDYLFLVLHFPLFNKQLRLTQPSEVDVFVGAKYVITVHSGELRPLTKLFQDCVASEAIRQETMGRSSGWLLYQILDDLVDYCFPILDKIVENVDQVEKRIFESTHENAVLLELAEVRRDILSYRRTIRPQIEVLKSMEAKEYSFLKVDPDIYFGDLADHIRRLWVDLEDLKEEAEGLHDTFDSLTSHRTGEVMRVVTVVGTIALPAIVIASIYGMNVDLPFQRSAAAFGTVMGVTFLVTAIILVYSHLRRWI